MPSLILASASPRRRWLLSELGVVFEAVPADLDEDALTLADPFETARTLARLKALSVAEKHPDALVLGSDTVVTYRDGDAWRQLAKPTDEADARRMLRILAGRTHTVATGVALVGPGVDDGFVATANVTFRPVTDEEIAAYVATGDPMDKAGSYGLQGHAGGWVTEIAGDRTAVIGLPQEATRDLLRAHGMIAG